MRSILSVNNLVKDYPGVRAVDQISFEIETGICFGLLGPNGAGKTTTLEMIEGIIEPSEGDIHYKSAPIGPAFKQEAGFLFQSTALQEFLTVEETLKLFQSLYTNTMPLEMVIERCSLGPILKRDNRKLSGGQKQRMLLAIALINNPEILFLDEPTTGLDPQSRRNFWELIENIKRENKTIILTTHYMEEAQRLCDKIAIIDQGKILEIDTPDNLLRKHFDDVILHLPATVFEVGGEALGLDYEIDDDEVLIHTTDVHKTFTLLQSANIDLHRIEVRNRNLEDLFLKLTGKDLRT